MKYSLNTNSNQQEFKEKVQSAISNKKGVLPTRILFKGDSFTFWNSSDAFFMGLFFPSLKGTIEANGSGQYELRYFWVFKNIAQIMIIESSIALIIGALISLAISNWSALIAFIIAVAVIDIACLTGYKKSTAALLNSFQEVINGI